MMDEIFVEDLSDHKRKFNRDPKNKSAINSFIQTIKFAFTIPPEARRNATHAVLIILSALSIYLFLVNPYKEDQKNFFTAAYCTDISHLSFPDNCVHTWELKPIGNRVFFYSLYKVTTLFVDYTNKPLFVSVSLFIYALFALLMFSVSFYLLKGYLTGKGINTLTAFYITVISFFAVCPEVSLQPEHISVVLFLVALAYALSNAISLQLISGLVITYLFLIKGITGALGLIVYLIILTDFNKFKKNFFTVFISNAVSFIAAVSIMYIYYPILIDDFKNAMQFQAINVLDPHNLKMLAGKNFVKALIIGSPTLVFGFMAYSYNLIDDLKKNKIRSILFISLIWAIVFTVPVLQGKGFMYHFAPLLIPSISSILIYANKEKVAKAHKRSVWNILIAVVIAALLSLIVKKGVSFRQDNLNEFKDENIVYREIDKKYSISSEPNVLFLSDGVANFYFATSYYSKYFFPLPIARVKTISKNNKEYIETLADILKYQGKFIVSYPEWICVEKHHELEEKIKNEYEVVYTNMAGTRSVAIYRRKLL